jgi:hypothetical protein
LDSARGSVDPARPWTSRSSPQGLFSPGEFFQALGFAMDNGLTAGEFRQLGILLKKLNASLID